MLLFSRFKIYGHSMEPTIVQGEAVVVSKIPFLLSKPKVGDVIAFKKKKKIFIKRIARIERQKYFITGDNKNDSLDSREFGWINKKEIVGKVIWNI